MHVYVSNRSQVLPNPPHRCKNSTPRRRKQSMTTHHFAARNSCRGDGPPVDVVAWRMCRLLEAGFPPELAERLAAEPGVDVHALLALVDRGCPPHLAARILSPLPTPGVRL